MTKTRNEETYCIIIIIFINYNLFSSSVLLDFDFLSVTLLRGLPVGAWTGALGLTAFWETTSTTDLNDKGSVIAISARTFLLSTTLADDIELMNML